MYRNKYNNKKCRYKGYIYASRREAADSMWLDSLLANGKLLEIQKQVKISVDVEGEHICNHYADFLVTLADGRMKYIETKGLVTEVYRLKLKLIKALYPKMSYLINPTEQEVLA